MQSSGHLLKHLRKFHFSPLATTFSIRELAKVSKKPFEYPFPKPEKKLTFLNLLGYKGMSVNLIAGLQKKKDFSYEGWKRMMRRLKANRNIFDQRYIAERHKILGADLAAAHFLVNRGGKIKFVGGTDWIFGQMEGYEKLPTKYVPGIHIEHIDATGMPLVYVGFDNLVHLTKLKSLNLSKCPLIDDWCLSRFYEYAETLESVNLSGCPNVSERGIACLHVLKNLKELDISDMPHLKEKELLCILLEEQFPNIKITGVDYLDSELLKQLEEETKLDEQLNQPSVQQLGSSQPEQVTEKASGKALT